MTLMSKNKNKKTLEKFHLTAIIKRTIIYTKDHGKMYKYDEENHKNLMSGHDKLTDSRVIEDTSEQEAQRIFHEALLDDHSYEEYSAAVRVHLDNVQFIDGPVVGSSITSSNPANIPLRQAGYLESRAPLATALPATPSSTCTPASILPSWASGGWAASSLASSPGRRATSASPMSSVGTSTPTAARVSRSSWTSSAGAAWRVSARPAAPARFRILAPVVASPASPPTRTRRTGDRHSRCPPPPPRRDQRCALGAEPGFRASFQLKLRPRRGRAGAGADCAVRRASRTVASPPPPTPPPSAEGRAGRVGGHEGPMAED
jgi:hypothetical protein